MKKYLLLAPTLIAATALAVPSLAATVTWTGESGTNGDDGETIYKWSDNGNWSSAWAEGTSVEFTASATNTTITIDGTISLGNGANLTISGGNYTFAYTGGSSLTVPLGTSIITITGSASLTLTEGTSNLRNNLYLGKEDNSSGTIHITAGTNTFNGGQLWLGYGTDSSGMLEITGGTENTFQNTSFWVGYGAGSTGTVTVSAGTRNNFWTTIYVGSYGTGTFEITGGTYNDFWDGPIYIGDYTGQSKMTISGGTSGFDNAKLYIGYGFSDLKTGSQSGNTEDIGGSGTLEITGGTNTFTSSLSMYVGSPTDNNATGTFIISGGTTTISGTTTIANGSSLSIGGGTEMATVNLNKQIGTAATGTVTISDNAKIILSGALLESLEATIDSGAQVAVITANEVIFGTLQLTSESTGEVDLDSVINKYISAGDYLLTWTWDTSDGTLYASVAGTIDVPEPSMFGMLLGLGALGLVATRRQRRKA